MLITPQNVRQWARANGYMSDELKCVLHDEAWKCWVCTGVYSRKGDGQDTSDGWTCDGCMEIPYCERSEGGAYSPYERRRS